MIHSYYWNCLITVCVHAIAQYAHRYNKHEQLYLAIKAGTCSHSVISEKSRHIDLSQAIIYKLCLLVPSKIQAFYIMSVTVWKLFSVPRNTHKSDRSHKNCLIGSSNIIYKIPEEHHKCQITKLKKAAPQQNKKYYILRK